jgi:TRAP-type C4-dicarboxylate transport system permease small subunit
VRETVVRRIRRVVDVLAGLLAVASALCASVLMVSISLDVAWRELVNRSIPGMVELSETAVVFMVYLGMAQAESSGMHVRMTLVTDRIPARAAHALRVAAFAVTLAFVGWMAWETGLRALDSVQRLEFRYGLLDWPIWPARLVIPIGLAVLMLQVLFRLGDSLSAALGRGDDR